MIIEIFIYLLFFILVSIIIFYQCLMIRYIVKTIKFIKSMKKMTTLMQKLRPIPKQKEDRGAYQ